MNKRRKMNKQTNILLKQVPSDVIFDKCMPFLTLSEHVFFSQACRYTMEILGGSPARTFWSHDCNRNTTVRLGPEITFSKWKKMTQCCYTQFLVMQNCCKLSNVNLQDICRVPLVTLQVLAFPVNMSFLRGLSSSLKKLHVESTNLEDSDFENFEGLSLNTLKICNEEKLWGDGLTRLCTMENTLRHLDLSGSTGTACLRSLTNLKLQVLILNTTQIENETLIDIRNMTSLEKLSLAHTNIDDNCLQYLQNLSNLRVLNLSDCFFTGDEEFEYIVNVTDLDVSHNIGFYTILHLVRLPLVTLNLMACINIVYIDLMPFSNTLVALNISLCSGIDTFSYDIGLALKRFDLCYLDIEDWTRLPKVPTMSMRASNIHDNDLKTLTNITHLDLSYCENITNDGLQNLQKSLIELSLVNCPKISSRCVHEFMKHRPDMVIHFETFEESSDEDDDTI